MAKQQMPKAVETTPAIDATAKNDVVNDASNESGANGSNDEPQKSAEGDKPAASDKPADVAAPAPKADPTSEKLTELKASLKTAWAKMIAQEDPESEAALAANLEVYKIKQEIKAEILNIEKTARDQELLEKRNARIQLATDLVNAVLAEQAFKSDVYDKAEDVTVTKEDGTVVSQKPQDLIDQMNALTHARKSAFEVVANELAARYATSAPAKKADGGSATVTVAGAGTKSEQIEQMMKAGKTYDEILAAGMGDGTIRTVAGNIKYKKNADGTYSQRA